jgi:hypothetical protein
MYNWFLTGNYQLGIWKPTFMHNQLLLSKNINKLIGIQFFLKRKNLASTYEKNKNKWPTLVWTLVLVLILKNWPDWYDLRQYQPDTNTSPVWTWGNTGMVFIQHQYTQKLFVGLAYQGKDIVFRFIKEYSSLRDFGP